MPALYENAKNGRLPVPFYILGFARRPWSHEKMREVLREGVEEFGRTKPVDFEILDALLENAYYIESAFETSQVIGNWTKRSPKSVFRTRFFIFRHHREIIRPSSGTSAKAALNHAHWVGGGLWSKSRSAATWIQPCLWMRNFMQSLLKIKSTAWTTILARRQSRIFTPSGRKRHL